MRKINLYEVIIILFFIIYIVTGLKLPLQLARMIDTRAGNATVWTISILMILLCHPLLGIISIFVAYDIIIQSSMQTGGYLVNQYSPSEQRKYAYLNEYNQFPITLEQEVIKNMAPIVGKPSMTLESSSFAPIIDNTHDAQTLY